MFIDHDDPDQLPRSVGAKHLAGKAHFAPLERGSSFSANVSINAALRQEKDLCLEL
jgi:hypothetical protein